MHIAILHGTNVIPHLVGAVETAETEKCIYIMA